MFILFFLFWIMLNGRITAEIAVFGVVISAALYVFVCLFTDFSPHKDFVIFSKLPLIVFYFIVLIIEIFKANLAMLPYLFSTKILPEPALVSFHVDFKTHISMVVLAGSITLTPGTITVEMHEGDYVVHCFDKSMAEDIKDSVFVKLLMKMEG